MKSRKSKSIPHLLIPQLSISAKVSVFHSDASVLFVSPKVTLALKGSSSVEFEDWP